MTNKLALTEFETKKKILDDKLAECLFHKGTFALEGVDTKFFTGMFKGLIGAVKNVTGYLTEFLSFEKKGALTIGAHQFAQAIKPIPYASVSEINAAVPEGLKSTYLEALQAISKSVDRVPTGIQHLEQYLSYLSAAVSDHRLTTSFADDKKFIATCAAERKACYDAIGKHFTAGSYKANQKIKDVLKKNGDWEKVIEITNDLVRRMESVDREQIDRKINQCSVYLSLLAKNFDEDGDRKVSQEAAKRLGDLTENIAREVEFFSLTYYRVLTMRGAIQNTTELVYNTFSG